VRGGLEGGGRRPERNHDEEDEGAKTRRGEATATRLILEPGEGQ
jgi:hypothetical protein